MGHHTWRTYLVALLLLITSASAWAEWNVASLMQQLARHPAGQARFTETKKLSVLDAPVVSSGRLIYSPPDRLEKITVQPKAESLTVESDQVVVVRDGRRRERGEARLRRHDDDEEDRHCRDRGRASGLTRSTVASEFAVHGVDGLPDRSRECRVCDW